MNIDIFVNNKCDIYQNRCLSLFYSQISPSWWGPHPERLFLVVLVFKEKYLSVEMLLPLTRAISKVSFFWKQKLPNFCFYMVSPFFIAWLLFTAMRNSSSTFLITSSTWAEIYYKKSIQYFWNLERFLLSCWMFYSSNKLDIQKGYAPCHYWAKNFVHLKIPIIPCLSIFASSLFLFTLNAGYRVLRWRFPPQK